MLTMDDITLTLGPTPNMEAIALAFVLDNEVVHTMLTYKNFYTLISSGYSVSEDPESPQGVFRLIFKENETVIETLECNELLSALLRSEPKIVVLVAEPKPPIEELGIKRYVTEGWTLGENNEFIPPAGWVHPEERPQPTEEQKAKLREMGVQI